MALALALMVGVLLSITVAVLLQTVGLRFYGVESQRHAAASFYVSDAGVQWGLYKLNRKIPPFDKQEVADWPVGLEKTETVTLFGDDLDHPEKHQDVQIKVKRVSATPGPGQFKINANTTLPGTT